MLRSAIGLLGLHVVLAATGMALLAALGLVERRPRSLAFALGPAYLFGVALVVPILIALVILGVPLTFGTLAVVTVVLSLALGVAAFRRSPPVPRAEAPRMPRLLAVGLTVAALLFTGLGAVSLARSTTGWDSAHIWSLRGLTLAHHHDLAPEVFEAQALAPFHLDYPILQPTLEALAYQGMGDDDVRLLHTVLWIVFCSFVWTVAYLLWRTQRSLAWVPIVALLAVIGAFYPPLELSYADTTVASFLGAGLLCVGLWLQSWRLAYAILGGLALGAAVNTKNEGLMAAGLVLLVAAVMVAVRRRRDGVVGWLAIAGLVGVSAMPWRLWIGSHGFRAGDFVPLSDAADPTFLIERLPRLGQGARAVLGQLGDPGRWHYVVPLLLALAVVALVARRGIRIAVFYLATLLLVIAGSSAAYWLSSWPDLTQHITASVDRVLISVGAIATVGVAHLVALIHAPDSSTLDDPGVSPERGPTTSIN